MMATRFEFAGALFAATVALSAAPASAQTKPNDKVIFALPVQAVSYSYGHIAKAKGYWSDVGLDVEMPLIAGNGAPNAMLAGQADFAAGTGNSLLLARAQGQKITAAFAPFQRMGLQLVVSKSLVKDAGSIKDMSMADRAKLLKGKTVAIDRPNAVPHAFARYILQEAGLDPERDVTFVPVDAPAMPTALAAGRVDAFVMSAPWPSVAVTNGKGVVLVDPLGGDLPEFYPMAYNIVMTRQGYCEQNESICKRFIIGLQKAANLMRDDPDAAGDAIAPVFDKMDRKLIKDALQDLQKTVPDKYEIDDEKMARMQRFVAATGRPEVAKLTSFEGFYTNGYLMK